MTRFTDALQRGIEAGFEAHSPHTKFYDMGIDILKIFLSREKFLPPEVYGDTLTSLVGPDWKERIREVENRRSS